MHNRGEGRRGEEEEGEEEVMVGVKRREDGWGKEKGRKGTF